MIMKVREVFPNETDIMEASGEQIEWWYRNIRSPWSTHEYKLLEKISERYHTMKVVESTIG